MARPANDGAKPVAATAGYELPGRPEISRGILLAMWIVICDVALKLVAHTAACTDPPRLTLAVFDGLWTEPTGCSRFELLGPLVTLLPRVRVGAPFGLLDEQLAGFAGQAWGLGLLALAAIATILIMRWRWRDAGDALALGALWGGALVHGVPRAQGAGNTFTEINLLDFGVGIGDLAFGWGIVWLLWRLVGELRAGG